MEMRSYDLEKGGGVRRPSLGRCIYCGDDTVPLTDEHVIPYALGGNGLILMGASCVPCARIIQKYEQRILNGQLGVFRARIDAPTRNKKNRPTQQNVAFVEVDQAGQFVRDLGFRRLPIEQTPLSLSVWELAPPRVLGEDAQDPLHVGRPWNSLFHSDSQRTLAARLARKVAEETGAGNVAVKVDTINREDFLRFLVKTAHAYAVFERGLNSFRPLTTDLILCRDHDLARYVGCCPINPEFESKPANMTEISIGTVKDGPAAGYTSVYIRIYPLLGTPPHIVIVGSPWK